MSGRSKDIASAFHAAAVTKSDATILPVTRGLYIGTAGDVAVTMASGATSIVFTAVPIGILPVQVTKVLSTGTTAALILALY